MNVNLYHVSTVAVGVIGLGWLVLGTAAALNLAATLGWTLIQVDPAVGLSLRPFVLLAFGLGIILGVVPGIALIMLRRHIARRWLLPSRDEARSDVPAVELARLVVSVAGFSFLAVAVHDLAQAVAYALAVPSGMGLATACIAPTVYFLAGAILLSGARRLAQSWGRP